MSRSPPPAAISEIADPRRRVSGGPPTTSGAAFGEGVTGVTGRAAVAPRAQRQKAGSHGTERRGASRAHGRWRVAPRRNLTQLTMERVLERGTERHPRSGQAHRRGEPGVGV